MSQQLNLLIQKQRAPGLSAERAIIGLVLLLAILLTYAFVERNKTNQVVGAAKRGDSQLAAQSASLLALEKQLAERPKAQELGAEVSALKAQVEEKRLIIEMFRSGGGGNVTGYHGHLITLARIAEDGVWLRSVKIGGAGKTLSVEGNSLRPEAVLRYAKRLNEGFSPLGIQFTAVDLSALPPVAGLFAAAEVPAVSFKLY